MIKMTYWISTILICAFLLINSYTYLFSKSTFEGVKALGFPIFFIYQLAILKVIAVIILLIPNVPVFVKD